MAVSEAAAGQSVASPRYAAGRSPNLGALALMLPALLLLVLLFVLPLGRLFALSFEGGTLDWYGKALTGGLYTTILLRTFEIAAIVTLCCLVIGYPVAFLLATTTPLWRALGFAFVMLPLWTSVLVRTYAWMVLLGRNGIINRVLIDSGLMETPLPMLNSKMAVVLGMVHVMLPFMILPIYSALTRVDSDLPKAARGLGASPQRVLTTIYLPMTLRGIVAGVTLVFVVSLGFYITPALLGGGKVLMFAMVIEQQVREFLAWNFAGALSAILLAVTLLAFWLLNQGVARHLGD
jgi:putative spermidine/putrescine transport system permease protein